MAVQNKLTHDNEPTGRPRRTDRETPVYTTVSVDAATGSTCPACGRLHEERRSFRDGRLSLYVHESRRAGFQKVLVEIVDSCLVFREVSRD